MKTLTFVLWGLSLTFVWGRQPRSTQVDPHPFYLHLPPMRLEGTADSTQFHPAWLLFRLPSA
eukprot:2415642-Amphidinium_carterae.2